LRSGPRSPSHLRLPQTLVITQQPATRLISILRIHQLPRPLSSLPDLDDLLQLGLSNLSSRKHQPPPRSNLLGLLELLDLSVPSGDELRGSGSLLLGLLLLLSSSLGLVLWGFTLSGGFDLGERLSDRSVVDSVLLVRGVVESRSGLLVERDVGVVLEGREGRSRGQLRFVSS